VAFRRYLLYTLSVFSTAAGIYHRLRVSTKPLFEVYDPYMDNTSQGNTINLGTVQDNVNKSEPNWDNVADVPNIIVVPETNFVAPSEQTTITVDYPRFDDYYADDSSDTNDTDGDLEVDVDYDDWFNSSSP
jgi:hypothetical protein